MDFIIDFFKSIDGIPYYIMLVVNAILIFAIIGYLGEKNNEELMKLGMNTTTTPDVKNGETNLATNEGSTPIPVASPTAIPTVAPTMSNANNVQSNNQSIPLQQLNSNNQVNQQVVNQPIINTQSIPNQNNNGIPVNNLVPIQSANQVGNQIPVNSPIDNTVDPNEKAPALLIINSTDSNKDAK